MALPWYVVLLIEILVLFVILWLSARIVAGARKSSSKLVMILLIAIIAVLVTPALASVAGQFGLGGLSAIIAYTILIVLVHVLVDIEWDKSIIIAFICELVVEILHAMGFEALPPL